MDYAGHMAGNGIEVVPPIDFDGRIHRFSTDGTRKKNGWYVAYESPMMVIYGDWRSPDIRHIWKDGGDNTELTDEQIAFIEQKRKEYREKEEARKARNRKRLAALWERLPDCHSHPYLNKKQVGAYNIKEVKGGKHHKMIVPMRDDSRAVVGLQIIFPSGFKRYARGSQPSGVYVGIGQPNGMIYIAEGYATGATIHAITGQAVAVCFSAGNIKNVATSLAASYPGLDIVIAADNDQFTSIKTAKGDQPNPGLYYAKEAADLIGCEYRLPQFADLDGKPTDFNDLYAREGESAVILYLSKLTENKAPDLPEIPEFTNGAFYDEQGDQFVSEESEGTSNAKDKKKDKSLHEAKFRCLGHSEDNYYFLPTKTNKIVSIGRGSMGSKTHLLTLASLDWWLDVFFYGSDRPDWTMATDYLLREQEKAGIFDPSNIRGRGAWFDNGRSVLHIGNRLIVDSELMNIDQFRTNYIYELSPSIESGVGMEPATVEQATQIYSLFREVNFERPASSHLLAGWCMLAPICSALDWRPHVWLTGARGTGKSWLQENIVDPIVGSIALRTQGSTTEAGIRQSLKQDGRPVIFDESESEDPQAQRRMKSVIELARQASSNSSSGITKGTAGGEALTYFIRSMFMFGSINVSISQAADESRISVLTLARHSKGKDEVDRFHNFERRVKESLTDEVTASIRARAYKMIPVIRHNAKMMARAIAEKLGSQRMGDQYGALLAGANAYLSDEMLSIDDARMVADAVDFSEAAESESVRDEERLLNAILQSQIRVEIGGHNYNRSIAEFVQIAINMGDAHIDNNDANRILERHGLRLDGGRLHVSNTHNEMKKLLANTPWASGWNRVLERLDGAEKSKNGIRFNGVLSRSVSLSIGEYIE